MAKELLSSHLKVRIPPKLRPLVAAAAEREGVAAAVIVRRAIHEFLSRHSRRKA